VLCNEARAPRVKAGPHDGNDPLPGYLEIDFVEHCSGVKCDCDFGHSRVMTDIATG